MTGIRGGRPSMRGSSRPRLQSTAAAPQHRVRVLFVCIGNSCRSQMAEGFARYLSAGRIEILSAGLSPASIVQDDTHKIMRKHGVLLDGQFPKGIELMLREPFDVIVNMSGEMLPRMNGPVVDWPVRDPIGQSEAVYARCAAEIEQRVKLLMAGLLPPQ